ncbi:MAG: glycosyltransferase family 39 protein, partial [Candidatus Hydrogenedentes bacterium]|nr:glycosyltransferase family 39 protein [Candidatus Hydrogenedentota bacterium]
MSDQPNENASAQALPNATLISVLQRIGIAGSFFLLFVSVLVSAVKPNALGGIVGINGVWIYTIAVAFFAVQHTWLRASGLLGRADTVSPASLWARFAFLCMFLICINAFVTTARGITHWGIVAGHDEPQYYAYLHSWFFDHDLNFENELKRIPGAWELMSEAHPERPEYNVAPIGTPLIWMPVYLAAHVVLLALHALGESVPVDGISTPYAFACAFGSSVCVWLGMLMIYATLKRWFSERAAFLATLLLWLASPIIWYQIDQPWMSHSPSFFAAALVLWIWARNCEQRTLTGWIALGATIGLALLGRPTHAVLILLPLADVVRAMRRSSDRLRAAIGFASALIACGVLFSLQLAVWYFRYDWATKGINTPPGSPMAWTHPAILEVLWSAHHGLFAWHPVLIAGFVGLIAFWKRARYVTLCIALLLAAYVYANAAIDAWFAGGSFGMRRFVCVLPFMAPGIAAFGVWSIHFCRKHYMVPISGLITLFFVYNALLMIQLRSGWTAFLTPVSFQQIWGASTTILHDTVGNPFSWPVNLWFAAKHDVSPSQYDVASGVPFTPDIDAQGPSLQPYLGTGWQTDYADAYRHNGAFLAQAQYNELLLYMHKGHAYDLTLSFTLPTQMTTPQQAAFSMNGKNLGRATLEPNAKSELKLFVPG